MKRETYDWLWCHIEKRIAAVEDSLSEVDKERLSFRRAYGDKTKEVIWGQYKRSRDGLKERCYRKKKTFSKNVNLIDQHKIATCFCDALLTKKVFAFNMDNQIPQKMLLSNYTLAYSVSLLIIYVYLHDFYKKVSPSSVHLQRLQTQGTLVTPRTTTSHDKYDLGRVKTLALNDYYGIKLDMLSYADMMFWIEHYNRQLIENSINVTPYTPESEPDEI